MLSSAGTASSGGKVLYKLLEGCELKSHTQEIVVWGFWASLVSHL